MKGTIYSLLIFSIGVCGGFVTRPRAPAGGAPAPEAAATSSASAPQVLSREECEGKLRAAMASDNDAQIQHWAGRLRAAGGADKAAKLLAEVETRRASKRDPFGEWERLNASGAKPKAGEIEGIVRAMARLDPARAWKMLTASGKLSSPAYRDIVADEWGKKQGYSAATFGLSMSDAFQRGAFLGRALTAWLAEDRVACSQWLARQPRELALERHLDIRRIGWTQSGQPLTLEDLDILTSLNTRAEEWSGPFDSIFERAWDAPEVRAHAAEWIGRQEDPTVRDSAWKALGLRLVKSDPAAAAGIVSQIQDEKERRELTSNIAARMTLANPEEALSFAGKIADPSAKRAAWSSVLATWAEHDPVRSLAYVREHSAEIEWETLGWAAKGWGAANPIEAVRVLTALLPEERRPQLISQVIREWHANRPQEARKWLLSDQAGAVSQATKDQILTPRKPEFSGFSTSTTTVGGRTLTVSF